VSELIVEYGNWKTQLVRDCFYPINADSILKIKPSKNNDKDILAWQPECNGTFTVCPAYHLAFSALLIQCACGSSISRADGSDPCWSRICGSSVPPKVKTFAWRAASNALLLYTKSTIRKFKIEIRG
jgi:hypothetical protein